MSVASMPYALSLSIAESAAPRAPAPSLASRVARWLAARSRMRLAAAEAALLERFPVAPGERRLALDGLSAELGLRARRDGSLDTVTSVARLAETPDPAALLGEIQRVLRPGGRLLFVEPAAARAGTWLRRLQRAIGAPWRLLAGTDAPPRDLWNDLKAAHPARLTLGHVTLRALGLVPVPHIVGEAVISDGPPPRRIPPRGSSRPAFAFFG